MLGKIEESRDNSNKLFNQVENNLKKADMSYTTDGQKQNNQVEPVTPLNKFKTYESSEFTEISTQAKTGAKERGHQTTGDLESSTGAKIDRKLTSIESSLFGKPGQNWMTKSSDIKISLPKIRLTNKVSETTRSFPVYNESHLLQLSKSLQSMLHKSTTDDDCETGELQARRAVEFCLKEAEECIEAKFEQQVLNQKSPSSSEMISLETVQVSLYKEDFERKDSSKESHTERSIHSNSSVSTKMQGQLTMFRR